MKIRNEQLRAFEEATLRAFEDEMVEHLRQFASRLSRVVGEAALRQAVRLGIERAGLYGWTNRGPVRFYIELMTLLGCDLDTDPLVPWAREGLEDRSVPDQMARADRLHGRLMDYFDRVVGPDGAYLQVALRKIHEARPDDYPGLVGGDEGEALAILRSFYPQRCDAAGDAALLALVRGGRDRARRLGAESVAEVGLFVALPFALGHGYAHDPFYPWITETLNDPRIADPRKRIARLYTRTRTYLGEVVVYLEGRS
jgi:hypothetical protein